MVSPGFPETVPSELLEMIQVKIFMRELYFQQLFPVEHWRFIFFEN
jgi:hypothetical protein